MLGCSICFVLGRMSVYARRTLHISCCYLSHPSPEISGYDVDHKQGEGEGTRHEHDSLSNSHNLGMCWAGGEISLNRRPSASRDETRPRARGQDNKNRTTCNAQTTSYPLLTLHPPHTMTATLTTTATARDSSETSQTSALATIELEGYDEEQIRLMEERCILVTPEDEAYGDVSKKTCKRSKGFRRSETHSRPPNDQHQPGSTPPRILSLPLSP